MMWTKAFWAVWGVVALGGCSTVTSVELLGERPKEIAEKEWAGTWLHQNQPVAIRVAEPHKGRLEVAWVEEKQGTFKLESHEVELRESGRWTFGNVRDTGSGGGYLWGLVSKDEGQIVVWLPDAKRCAALVNAGTFPGVVEKDGDVILKKLSPEQLNLVASGTQGGCMKWMEPVVFFRIGK